LKGKYIRILGPVYDNEKENLWIYNNETYAIAKKNPV
jgi:hypothetical protein